MKTSSSPAATFRLHAAHADEAGVARGRATAIMPAMTTAVGCVVLLLGASVLAELVVLPLSLALVAVIEALRSVITTDAVGFATHVSERIEPLLRLSVWGALALGTLACAAFVADLRRQRWL